jgi:outer membrane lipoprotein SlyB
MTMLTSLMKKAAPAIAAILIPCTMSSCMSPALLMAQQGAHGSIAKRGGNAADQQRFAKDQRNTVLQGTGVGALLGAGLGAALGGGRGAAYGALIGAALGNQFGQSVAMKKALAQTTEANLDAAINEASRKNAAARQRVSSLRSQLATYKARINKARASNDARELARIKTDLGKLDNQIAGEVNDMDGDIGMQRQLVTKVGSGNTRYARLNSGLRESTENRNALESERRQVASLMNSL